jgi:hypothetical protein
VLSAHGAPITTAGVTPGTQNELSQLVGAAAAATGWSRLADAKQIRMAGIGRCLNFELAKSQMRFFRIDFADSIDLSAFSSHRNLMLNPPSAI